VTIDKKAEIHLLIFLYSICSSINASLDILFAYSYTTPQPIDKAEDRV
jgi:hypothetical protein